MVVKTKTSINWKIVTIHELLSSTLQNHPGEAMNFPPYCSLLTKIIRFLIFPKLILSYFFCDSFYHYFCPQLTHHFWSLTPFPHTYTHTNIHTHTHRIGSANLSEKSGQMHVEIFEMPNCHFPPLYNIWARNACLSKLLTYSYLKAYFSPGPA